MKYLRNFGCLLSAVACAFGANAQKSNFPLYKDATATVEDRVNDLLSRMTLEEKIAQLSHLHGHQLYSGQEVAIKKLEDAAGDKSYGCVEGFTLSGPNCIRAMYTIQQYMVEKTRLGIPVFTVTESLHGSVQDGSTIFPQSVAVGSTFNTDLAYRMAAAISLELKAQGMVQSLSPGMDVVRDLRWGRVEESFGEDPWLVGTMGTAQVRGYLDHGISPMLKPFGAGGAPLGGLNLASVEGGERDLRDIYLKPYEMAVKSTDVMAVMSSYNSWDKIPNSSSRFLLTDILRNEWGFKGYVYSDWAAVAMLKDFHHTAEDDADAGKQALLAGLDLEASSNCFEKLVELVQLKQLDESYIDQAVERVLTVKFKLGLFEHPFPDTTGYDLKIRTPEAVALSREIADESIVLLKNDGQLVPLDPDKMKSIAVIGPNADQVQFGDYTWSRDNKDGVTPLQGISNLLNGRVKLRYAKGCDLVSQDRSGIEEAVHAARDSEVSIIFVGSSSASLARDYSDATTGEGFDLSNLDLTGVQEELVKAVYAVGKPVIVVLVTGKPFSIPWLKEHIPAIVVQWYGGERSGDAIADMLFGETNPSAKLPFSFPQSVGHLPVYYNYLPSDKGYYRKRGSPDKPGRDYVFSSPDPLWAFGYGLSYTTFDYSNVVLSDTILHATDTLKIKLRIYNSGTRDGKEIVQLYVRDLKSSVVTPVQQLKGFSKPFIRAKETETVILTLPISELALYNSQMERVVEPGDFEIRIGSASDDIRVKKTITVRDPKQITAPDKAGPVGEATNRVQHDTAVSQELVSISGKVRDVQATPIESVTIRSLRYGTIAVTDKQGAYTIRAYADDVLEFSADGYHAIRVPVHQQKDISVKMNRNTTDF